MSGRRGKLNYMVMTLSPQPGIWGNLLGLWLVGQSGKNMCQGGKPDTGKFQSSYIGMNVCGSAYENRCVVDGTCATAADYYY